MSKNIANKVEHNSYYYQNRYMEFIHPKKEKQKYRVYKYKGKFKDISKMSGIDVLFLLLFHLCGIPILYLPTMNTILISSNKIWVFNMYSFFSVYVNRILNYLLC